MQKNENKAFFLLENEQFKVRKPNKRVTDSNRPTLGYTFLNHASHLIDKTQEKYHFGSPNSLGPPPPSILDLHPSIPHFSKVT